MAIEVNLNVMIDQIFEKEPDAICLITDGTQIVAILDIEQWGNVPATMKTRKMLCEYKAPFFINHAEVPEMGVVVKVDLSECERWESVDGK